MGEGKDVRVAFDGPELEHDALIGHIEARIREEVARSSDASDSASRTAQFNEETGMNNQALSWCKSILKKLPKKDGQHKAMDVIMSLKAALPMVEAHVRGQGTTEMDFEEPKKAPAKGKKTSEKAAEKAPETVDEEPDDETAEFNSDVDDAMGEIHQFNPGEVKLPGDGDEAA
ncbi:MAG: hypothetical protein JXQ91_07580 [Vannielia sp.]|uniref:hypothetical protein n=1 Tax=Vannielia sp. TaxID=2813045 RepID=UPI003B8C684E